MADKSLIEWTDATWNPIRGCSRVSEGCRHCYAEGVAARFSGPGLPYEGLTRNGRWNGEVRVVEEKMAEPLRWRRPRRIFVNSMSDLFHPAVSLATVARIFNVMASATPECGRRHEHEPECWTGPSHTYQVLTKRPARMREVLEELPRYVAEHMPGDSALGVMMDAGAWPLPNVWLGVSVEDQAAADRRIPLLLQTPAAVRWVSAEPLLGRVDLRRWLESIPSTFPLHVGRDGPVYSPDTTFSPSLDWVVVGGESGRGARPMHPDWVRSLRDQCADAAVPFLFKQWGQWVHPMQLTDSQWRDVEASDYDAAHGDALIGVGKRAAGRELDGRIHDEYPEVAR